MVYLIILAFHIGAAVTTIGLGAYALFALARGTTGQYRALALALGFIAGFEVLSGTVLAVLSPAITAAYLSTHIAVYLGSCALIEALLFVRMRQGLIAFPLKLAAAPALASVALFATAVAYGF